MITSQIEIVKVGDILRWGDMNRLPDVVIWCDGVYVKTDVGDLSVDEISQLRNSHGVPVKAITFDSKGVRAVQLAGSYELRLRRFDPEGFEKIS